MELPQKTLDGIDKKILKMLMNDVRVPIIKISKEVGITGAAVHKRIKKLRDSGLIKGSKLLINHLTMGYTTLAFVGIYLNEAARNNETVQRLKDIPEILECHFTTGNWSILIKVICKNNEHLMQFLYTKIQKIEGVSRTETFISLHQQIDRDFIS